MRLNILTQAAAIQKGILVNPAAQAAKSATSTIPVVFFTDNDPVAVGLVASLARPDGNLTGIGGFDVELMPRRFELISELVPQAGVIALLVNPSNPDPPKAEVARSIRVGSNQPASGD